MKVFISYRRQDSVVITGRIYDRLISAFGERTVFRDIDDIPAGKDFRAVLDDAVGKSNIMLVIIGPQWAGITDDHGNRRLMDPNDFVRIEVESVLKRQDILVIPVIVMGTSLPVREELPESLYELIYRNAVVIRNDPDFDTDMRRLIRQIRSSAPITQKVSPKVGLGIISLLLLVALAFAGLTFLVKPPPRALTPVVTTVYSQTTPSSANEVSDISVGAGFGARGKGWQLFFTNPGNNQSPATLIDASKLMNTTIIASRAVSLFQEPNQDSMIVLRVPAGDSFLITQANADNSWMHVRLQDNTDGWILTDDIVLVSATPLAVSAKSQYGINIRLVDAIGRAKKSLTLPPLR